MVSRKNYIAYLGEHGLREADVLPLVNIPKGERERFGLSLQYLFVTGEITKEERDEWGRWADSSLTCNDLIARVHDRLKDDLKRAGVSCHGSTFAGVRPTPFMNGRCESTSGGFLLILTTGCSELLEVLASLVVSRSAGSEQELKKVLCDFWERRMVPSPASYVAPGIDEKHRGAVKLVVLLGHEALSFVIAHELAHASLGHPQFPTQVQELEADAWALMTMLKRNSIPTASCPLRGVTVAAAIMFLSLVSICEARMMADPDRAGLRSQDTHPVSGLRIELAVRIAQRLSHNPGAFELQSTKLVASTCRLLSYPNGPKITVQDSNMIDNVFSSMKIRLGYIS